MAKIDVVYVERKDGVWSICFIREKSTSKAKRGESPKGKTQK